MAARGAGRRRPARAAGRRRRARVDRRSRSARARGQDAREALLRAAGELVATRGFREASVDEIAERAGYSKGALYWHFPSKDDLFFALLEERVDAPTREMVELLRSAPPEQDMSVEASRRFADLLRSEPELLLLEDEYRAQAMRAPRIRSRYAKRQAAIREAVAGALAARAEHLGTPIAERQADDFATVILALGAGLAQQRLIDPDSVPDELLGETIALIYRGLVARAAPRK